MANLLSWLGGAANRVAHTVNNDVVKPIQRDVVAPVQRGAGVINNAPVAAVRQAPSALQGFNRNVAQPFNQALYNVATGLTVNPVIQYGKAVNASINNPRLQADTIAATNAANQQEDNTWKLFRAGKIDAQRATNLINDARKQRALATGNLQGQMENQYQQGLDPASIKAGLGQIGLTAALPTIGAAGVGGKVAETGIGAGFSAQQLSQVPSEVARIKTLKGPERTQAIAELVANTGVGVLGAAAAAHGAVGLAGEARGALAPPSDAVKLAGARSVQQGLTAEQVAVKEAQAAQAQRVADYTRMNALDLPKIQGEKTVALNKQAAQKTAALETERQTLIKQRQQQLDQANAPKLGNPMVRDVRTGAQPNLDTRFAPAGAPKVPGAPVVNDVPTARKLPVTEIPVSAPKGAPVKPVRPVTETEVPKVAPDANTTFENATIGKKPGIIAQVRDKFNPVAQFGEAGKKASVAFQSKLGDIAAALRPAAKDSAARQATFDKMTPQEHLKFINDMQHGVPQPTPELQAIADQYAKFNAQGADIAKGIKPDFKAMDNYFTQAGIVSKADASKLAQLWMDKSNTPGSLQHREFPSVQEAVKFANDNGVSLAETNPEKLFMRNHQQVLTAGALNDFKNEHAANGGNPEIAQKLIDRYSERGLSGGAGYEAYRKGAGTLNNIQLAGGFHYGKTAFEKINNDLAVAVNEGLSGHPVKAVVGGVKNVGSDIALFGYFKGRSFASDVANGVKNKYTEAAQMANYNPATDARYAVDGIKSKFNKTVADVTSGNPLKVGRGVVLAVPREVVGLINTGMSPLMKHFVPNVKNAAFMSQVDAADAILGKGASAEERAMAYQKAGATVDGIFGQMNQDNLFWSKTMKDSMSIAMRSPGYNIGTVQQVGGGLKDLASPGTYKNLAQGKGLSTRAAYTVALTANTAILGAITTYMFTGKGPTQLVDYFYPPTGRTDKNGNPERVSLPSYAKDVFSFIHNPAQTVVNKLGPAWSEGAQLATNRDYYGNYIHNPEDSAGTQLAQVGTYLKNTNQPFSLQSANKRVDQGIGAKAESGLGMTVAPGYITQSPFQQKVQDALNKTGHTPLTPEEVAVNKLKSDAKVQAAGGDSTKIDQLVKSGQITSKQGDNLKQASGQTSLQNQFGLLLRVDKTAAGNLIAHASPEELSKLKQSDIQKAQDALVLSNAKKGQSTNVQSTSGSGTSDITPLPSGKFSATIDGTDKTFNTKQQAQTEINFQNFKDSGKNYEINGNMVFRQSADGNYTKMTKDAFDNKVNAATLTSQKNSEDVKGWMQTAQKQLQNIQTQMQDPSVDPFDQLTLQNQADALQKQIEKYNSYGGFTKPKVAKKLSSTRFKVANTKTPTIKGIKVKVASAKFKAPATRKLSVSKIPSSATKRKLA